MNETLTFSRPQFEAYSACQRQFELRNVQRLTWPSMPWRLETETAVANGRAFHQLIERHFLKLPVHPPEGILSDWWRTFEQSPLAHPPLGRALTECRLTVPLGGHLLMARFDLLIIGQHDATPFIHIFDWKTGRARPRSELQTDWQTRLYLALAAESGHALFRDAPALQPEQIQMTYWYVDAPDKPCTIAYNSGWHAQNWGEIKHVIDDIDAKLASGTGTEWPKTDEIATCRSCAYQIYCQRQQAGMATSAETDDDLIDNWPGWDEIEPDVVPQT